MVDVWFKQLSGSCISLGDYIILDYCYLGHRSSVAVAHEYGHQRQSLFLGWLYLLVVGLPFLVRNLWDRTFHGNWLPCRREKWHYDGFPERWADALGGVLRVDTKDFL